VGAAFAAKKLGLHLWLLWNGMTTAAKKINHSDKLLHNVMPR
jgi:hypothetical protein